MTPETKSDLRTAGGIIGLTAAALTVGVLLIPSPPSPKKIRFTWDMVDLIPGAAYTTEVWSSTNLTTWTLRTNTSTNFISFPADKSQEFFKIRNRLQIGTNVLFSDWARKPTL